MVAENATKRLTRGLREGSTGVDGDYSEKIRWITDLR
jgi:hypothetical protein